MVAMVDLQKSLALISARLNEEARKAMFDLLSGELLGRVEDLSRHADPMGEELAPYQQRLVVGFEDPVQVEDKNVVGETVEDASLAGFIAEDAPDESDPLAHLPKQNAQARVTIAFPTTQQQQTTHTTHITQHTTHNSQYITHTHTLNIG